MPASEFDVAVIGGGIAGISAAAELSRDANVLLLERESQPGYHSSGRSAATLAQNYGTPPMHALTRLSEPFLSRPPEGFSSVPLLSARGLMRIAREDQVATLMHLAEDMKDNSKLTWLTGDEIVARAPLLRPGHITQAFLNNDAADIDVHALMQGYLRMARASGATIRTSAPVTSLDWQDGQWRIGTPDDDVTATVVVNASGAWVDEVASLAGFRPLGITPMRRTALTFAAPGNVDVAALPMIVDADEHFYVKPEAGKLMASPGDETPTAPCDAQPEELDMAICIDRVTSACLLEVNRIDSAWAGLRSFAPDRLPVCGFASDNSSFFWLAGQGGAGVQTSPALARLTAALVLGQSTDALVSDSELDLSVLSPARLALTG